MIRATPVRGATAAASLIEPGGSTANSFRDTSRGEYVYRALRDAIGRGQYRQGERIREEDIAKSMGVSRTPVREALRRLQTRGLLELAAGRGLVVAELSRQQVLELYAMRELLEGAAARLAAQHATETEVAYLRHLLKELRTETSPKRLADLNRVFHHAICDAAHNRYMQQSLNDLGDALALLRDTTFAVVGRPKTADIEHVAIVDAIEKHDPDVAERAARDHIRQAQQLRMQLLASRH
jgi:DNA-binding GntR family transcriptional regulator